MHVLNIETISSSLIGLITSSLTKYLGLYYGCTLVVPSSLILLPIGSSLTGCMLFWLKLIANGHHEYHKEYNQPNTSSFANKGLLSSNLQWSLCQVNVHLRTLTLQLTHRLCDSKLNCFFLILTLVWMYYVQMTYIFST